MPLSTIVQNQLQQLMQEDPALVVQVHGAEDAASVAAILAVAAANKGIAVTAEELVVYFGDATQAASDQSLSDEQLDVVAGGAGIVDTVFMSIFTLGIGCAVVSIQRSVERSSAGKYGACTLD